MKHQSESATRRAASRKAHNNGKDVPHGTIKRYRGSRTRKPCHCDRCRTAWSTYISERKAKAK